nr:PKD domain-containing protein [uncultured Methanospirillum sp.]
MNRFCSLEVLMIVLLGFLISITGQVSALNAQFMMKPVQGQAPLTVFFVDSSSGAPSDWRWDFGDGSTGEGRQIIHTYLQPGKYTVSMTVFDESGSDTSTLPDAIFVVNNPFYSSIPVVPGIKPSFMADFKVSTRSGTTPLQVQFTDLSSGDPTAWKWEFGDGDTDSVQNPVHIYTKPGTYPVSLSISKEGSTSSKEEKNYISVSEGQRAASMNTVTSNQTSEQASGTEYSQSSTSVPLQATGTPVSLTSASSATTTDSSSSGEKYSLLNRPLIDFYNKTQALFEFSPSGTQDLLTISTNPVTVKVGKPFVSVISGKPGEDVYIWIVVPENVADSDNPIIPFFEGNQSDIMRDYPTGPYQIGAYIPSGEGEGISLKSLIPTDSVYQGTTSYGQIRLNQTGKGIISWETTGTTPGKYFIRAESKSVEASSANIQTAAASLIVF